MTEGGRVPFDFYSWHNYFTDPKIIETHANYVRQQLDQWGYTETESICNEWNYMEFFDGEQYRRSLMVIISMKGAAFTASVMSKAQSAPVDMLMYYDAKVVIFLMKNIITGTEDFSHRFK